MDSWTSEQFQPSATLENTHIKIQTENIKTDTERTEKFKKRADELKPPYYPPVDKKTIDWEVRHQKARQQVRKDQSYQFVMMVSAFANLKMERLWTTPSEEPKQSSGRATEGGDSFNELGTMTDMFSKEQLFQHKWTTTPEVSGLMYLSPMMYGHVQEAFDIIDRVNPNLAKDPNDLIDNSKYRTLYARLVAIRIKLSNFLSGVNYQLDRNWQRLHKEQSMILRHFRVRTRVRTHKRHMHNTNTINI
mgnify:CR=1 FL=1|tara:strand:- start:738 stop:1478 length:741 start_codon:yes stop_codon:yes gene_type:complete